MKKRKNEEVKNREKNKKNFSLIPEEYATEYERAMRRKAYMEAMQSWNKTGQRIKGEVANLAKQRENFRKSIQPEKDIDHEEARKNAVKKEQIEKNRRIHEKLEEYVQEKGIANKGLMTDYENGMIIIAWFDEQGKMQREEFTESEILAMRQKENAEE